MQKTFTVLLAAAFAIGVFGLWLALWTLEKSYGYHFKDRALPAFTLLVFKVKFALLAFPILCLVFSAFVIAKKQPTVGGSLVFLGVLALTFSFLAVATVLGALLPLMPIIYSVGGVQ